MIGLDRGEGSFSRDWDSFGVFVLGSGTKASSLSFGAGPTTPAARISAGTAVVAVGSDVAGQMLCEAGRGAASWALICAPAFSQKEVFQLDEKHGPDVFNGFSEKRLTSEYHN